MTTESRGIVRRTWNEAIAPYWLWIVVPFVGLFLLIVVLLLLTQSSVLAPFIYALS